MGCACRAAQAGLARCEVVVAATVLACPGVKRLLSCLSAFDELAARGMVVLRLPLPSRHSMRTCLCSRRRLDWLGDSCSAAFFSQC